MSVRRGARAPPAAARPGTLCGPAITLSGPAIAPKVGAFERAAPTSMFRTGVLDDDADLDAEKARLLEALEENERKRARRAHVRNARVAGRISYSSMARQEYCVDDGAGGYWWYPNVKEPTIYRSLGGPKFFAKTRDEPHEWVEFTSEGLDHYSYGEDPPPLKFQVGEKVSFVPYTRSQLLFDKDDKLIIHCEQCDDGRGDHPVAIPPDWAGVATQVRRLGRLG